MTDLRRIPVSHILAKIRLKLSKQRELTQILPRPMPDSIRSITRSFHSVFILCSGFPQSLVMILDKDLYRAIYPEASYKRRSWETGEDVNDDFWCEG